VIQVVNPVPLPRQEISARSLDALEERRRVQHSAHGAAAVAPARASPVAVVVVAAAATVAPRALVHPAERRAKVAKGKV